MKNEKFILWFKELSIKDVPIAGGKNASLGEMYSKLTPKGVNVPNGFAITSFGFWYFLERNRLKEKLKELFGKLDPKSVKSIKETGKKARNLIFKADFPEDLKKEIILAYQKLSREYGEEKVDVAVRSSGTAEDLVSASFAGQHETFLNIRGEEELLKAVKKCFASLFTDRAIAYREEKGFSHLKVAL
ncbi:phosphoenolpyruvate synthase, partial [Candidatus Parcubacteria bacterium]|nr:phosphoenolpyruvate synthase [Candidatus Parcubacteria bacterium]